MLKLPLRHQFLFGQGMVSDDTDHTVFVAQALLESQGDSTSFTRSLAWKLRLWLLTLPAGVGFATLRSILKLWLGFQPPRSSVFSAGNGPAMRSAIIGAYFSGDSNLRRQFVTESSGITHSDPQAFDGALAIAEVAAQLARNPKEKPRFDELESLLHAVNNAPSWLEPVDRALAACRSGNLTDALATGAESAGVSGYVNHTVPVAVAAWYLHFGDFRATIESIVRLGGDTDTVAAIAGALAGITCGREGIPADWVANLADYPHGPRFLSQLAELLSTSERSGFSFSWALFLRSPIFTVTVLAHGLRRLFPPY